MKKQDGFILKYIFWIIIIILILSFFSFNLREFTESNIVRENFVYLKDVVSNFWEVILKPFYEWIMNLLGSSIYNTIIDLQSGSFNFNNSGLVIPKLPGESI